MNLLLILAENNNNLIECRTCVDFNASCQKYAKSGGGGGEEWENNFETLTKK